MKSDIKPVQKQPEMKDAGSQSAVVVKKPKKRTKSNLRKVVLKIIVFNVVNVILVILILVLVGGLSKKAAEVRDLRNISAVSQEIVDVAVLKADVDGRAKEVEKIMSVFVNEDSFLKFLDEKDKLQATGVVSDFSVSDRVVKDASGNKGYALLIEFKGGMNEVKQALETLERLPFLMRTASLDVNLLREENQVRVKYVGFLYVNE